MPDKSTVKSNRERYAERMKSKYPDREFADDEALWGKSMKITTVTTRR